MQIKNINYIFTIFILTNLTICRLTFSNIRLSSFRLIIEVCPFVLWYNCRICSNYFVQTFDGSLDYYLSVSWQSLYFISEIE